MAYTTVKELMTAIADVIRGYLGGGKIPSQDLPIKVMEVHSHGYDSGYDSGRVDGYAEGKKAQYDEFWDEYQKSSSFVGSFAGFGWTEKTLKPKENMRPVNASYMFYYNQIGGDLVEFLESLAIELDFTRCQNANAIFQYSKFTRVGKIYCEDKAWYSSFASCSNLVTIDEWGSATGGTISGGLSGTFNGCIALENITVKGTIISTINFQWSTKLSKSSWISIVNAYSTTVSNLSMTGSLVSVNKAFETSEGANDGSTSEEWLNLIATKPNVTFNLV